MNPKRKGLMKRMTNEFKMESDVDSLSKVVF